MKQLVLILVTLALCGCTSGYRVRKAETLRVQILGASCDEAAISIAEQGWAPYSTKKEGGMFEIDLPEMRPGGRSLTYSSFGWRRYGTEEFEIVKVTCGGQPVLECSLVEFRRLCTHDSGVYVLDLASRRVKKKPEANKAVD